MKCPNCRAEAPEGATECPSCGVIFAKWEKKIHAAEPAALNPADSVLGLSEAGATRLLFLVMALFVPIVYFQLIVVSLIPLSVIAAQMIIGLAFAARLGELAFFWAIGAVHIAVFAPLYFVIARGISRKIFTLTDKGAREGALAAIAALMIAPSFFPIYSSAGGIRYREERWSLPGCIRALYLSHRRKGPPSEDEKKRCIAQQCPPRFDGQWTPFIGYDQEGNASCSLAGGDQGTHVTNGNTYFLGPCPGPAAADAAERRFTEPLPDDLYRGCVEEIGLYCPTRRDNAQEARECLRGNYSLLKAKCRTALGL